MNFIKEVEGRTSDLSSPKSGFTTHTIEVGDEGKQCEEDATLSHVRKTAGRILLAAAVPGMTLGRRVKSDLDGDIDAGGEIELFQLVHGAGGGIDDVEQALVGADFELFGGFFIHVDGAVHGELLNPGRERHGAGDTGAGAGFRPTRTGTVAGMIVRRTGGTSIGGLENV